MLLSWDQVLKLKALKGNKYRKPHSLKTKLFLGVRKKRLAQKQRQSCTWLWAHPEAGQHHCTPTQHFPPVCHPAMPPCTQNRSIKEWCKRNGGREGGKIHIFFPTATAHCVCHHYPRYTPPLLLDKGCYWKMLELLLKQNQTGWWILLVISSKKIKCKTQPLFMMSKLLLFHWLRHVHNF